MPKDRLIMNTTKPAKNSIKIGLASDHAGVEFKAFVQNALKDSGYSVVDYGVDSSDQSVDYPDYASKCAFAVKEKSVDYGVLICGTGIGMSIAANKIPGIRAALVSDEFSTRMIKRHNNSNMLCLGARTTNKFRAVELINIWLEETYEDGRHQRRLDKITDIEKKFSRT